MRRTTVSILAVLVICALAGACATRQPVLGQKTTGFDKKLSTFAYIEEGDLITLIVDTRVARDKDGQAYMPLEIAIANHGFRTLTLTLESFTLLDGEGNRYPAASPRELLKNYGMLDFDRNLAELEGIIFNRFAANPRYPSNFSPVRSASVGVNSLVRDRVALPRHGYLIDFVYFPTPVTGIREQPFELFLNAPELQDPVFVKFEVR
jgi:hypothetical protein